MPIKLDTNANKATLTGFSLAVAAVSAWGFSLYTGESMPAEIALAISTIVLTPLVYWVRNKPKPKPVTAESSSLSYWDNNGRRR